MKDNFFRVGAFAALYLPLYEVRGKELVCAGGHKWPHYWQGREFPKFCSECGQAHKEIETLVRRPYTLYDLNELGLIAVDRFTQVRYLDQQDGQPLILKSNMGNDGTQLEMPQDFSYYKGVVTPLSGAAILACIARFKALYGEELLAVVGNPEKLVIDFGVLRWWMW